MQTIKSNSSPLTGKICYSPSVLQVVMHAPVVALFITRTHSLSLILRLTVSRYLATQDCINMTSAARDLVTDSWMYPSGLVIDTFNHLIVCDALNRTTASVLP